MRLEIDCSLTRPPDKREIWHELTDEDLAQAEADASEDAEISARFRRAERNMLLASSDWTQVPDAPISEETRKAWKKYRQQLRDNPTGPWPDPPS